MPKGLRKFNFAFDTEGLTRYGGILLFQSFCKSLSLRYFLQHYASWPTYVGFNRKYRGKASYAPIISSEGRTGLSLGMELRAGNIDASTGALIFLRQMLSKLPSSMAAGRTRLRLDGAFYDKDIILPLEGDGYGYAVVATMTGPFWCGLFNFFAFNSFSKAAMI